MQPVYESYHHYKNNAIVLNTWRKPIQIEFYSYNFILITIKNYQSFNLFFRLPSSIWRMNVKLSENERKTRLKTS